MNSARTPAAKPEAVKEIRHQFIVIAHTKVKINSPGLKVLSVYPYRPSDASCVETRTTSPNCRLPARPDSDSAKNIGTMLFAGWQSLGNKVESS